MPVYTPSPSERSFIFQYGKMFDGIASDLTDLHRQTQAMTYNSLRTAEDRIISPIRGLANFTADIEYDLKAITHQMYNLRYYSLGAPMADFEGDPVPILMNVVQRAHFNGTLASLGYGQVPGYSIADTDFAIRSLGAPLAKFMASRSAQLPTAASGATPNVTVSNTANGWQIVYTPYYVTSENGFGGPSTPVSGYLNPGRYRFGIKQSSPAQWDTSSWSIPSQPNPYIPLP
jgi:hypothetical protein